jgi:hypothetical protein
MSQPRAGRVPAPFWFVDDHYHRQLGIAYGIGGNDGEGVSQRLGPARCESRIEPMTAMAISMAVLETSFRSNFKLTGAGGTMAGHGRDLPHTDRAAP